MQHSFQITQITDMMTESNKPQHVYDIYTYYWKRALLFSLSLNETNITIIPLFHCYTIFEKKKKKIHWNNDKKWHHPKKFF